MKKFIFITITLIISGIVLWSCSDDGGVTTEPLNKKPTCRITSPTANYVISEGDTISVSVLADDSDGEISNVYFFIDSTLADSSSSVPFNAKVETLGLELGNHYLIACSKDNDNELSEPDSIIFSTSPKSPSNFLISQVDITTSNLTWNDNSIGEDKFVVERKLDSETDYQMIVEIDGNDSNLKSYTDLGLNPTFTYNYRVKAVKDTFESEYIAFTFSNIFSAPSNLLVNQINVYTFSLNWTDNSNGEDGFKIERKIDAGEFALIDSTTTNSYIDDSVAKKGYGSVYYQVRAYKNNYYSDYSSNNSSVDFPAPTDLTFTKENIYSIKLDWVDHSDGEDGFKIDKRVGTNEWDIGFATVGQNIQTWTDSNADINENLEYRVYAFKGSNISSAVTTSIIDNTFPAPTDLTITQASLTSTNLTWTDNSIGEERFEIERKLSSESTFVKIGEVTGSDAASKTFNDVTLETSESYDYRIKAFNGIYSSLYLTNTYINLFPAPTNLIVSHTNITSANLTWEDNSIGEDKFEIERKLTTDTLYNKIAEVAGDLTTGMKQYDDATLSPDKSYDYRVKAVKNINSSQYVTKTGYIAFPAPTRLTAFAISETSIKLEWVDNSTGEEGFIIDRMIEPDSTWVINFASHGADMTVWIDKELSSGSIYNYRVRAYYQEFTSNNSNEASSIAHVEYIQIPAGSFSMGSTPGESDEVPIHTVNITKPYLLGKYEVTLKEWELYMPAGVYGYGLGDNYPIYWINWYTILVYCNNRSIAEGLLPCYSISESSNPTDWGSIPTTSNSKWDAVVCNFNNNGYRLPTEAEWEYAARYSNGRIYPWGDTDPTSTRCNYNNNEGKSTIVGNYPTGNSYLGLCDMAGNVYEWVWDWYGTYPSETQTDPTGQTLTQIARVVRGGGWNSNIYGVRCARRYNNIPNTLGYIGFRLARTK